MFVLASNSPRRRELLSLLGIDFRVHSPEIEEKREPPETPLEYVKRISALKAECVAAFYSDFDFLLSADTIVVIDKGIIGKPEDDSDAIRMLKKLSGKTHRVITAYTLITKDKTFTEAVSTGVTFKKLKSEEIKRYVETGEAQDKAGAYAIQGYAAYMVEHISGSYTNVMGLPLAEVYSALEKNGYKFK